MSSLGFEPKTGIWTALLEPLKCLQCSPKVKYTGAQVRKNQQNDLCTQQRLRQAKCFFTWTATTLITWHWADAQTWQMPSLIWGTGTFVGFALLRLTYSALAQKPRKSLGIFLTSHHWLICKFISWLWFYQFTNFIQKCERLLDLRHNVLLVELVQFDIYAFFVTLVCSA